MLVLSALSPRRPPVEQSVRVVSHLHVAEKRANESVGLYETRRACGGEMRQDVSTHGLRIAGHEGATATRICHHLTNCASPEDSGPRCATTKTKGVQALEGDMSIVYSHAFINVMDVSRTKV